jgi:peptidoglycan hydrolase-like protein with peptidoglycan-binding domain
MMLRFTFVFLTSLTAITTSVGIARGAIREVSSSDHEPAQMIAQADQSSPAFLVDPAAANNTGEVVPNVTNPRTNPSSQAIGMGSQGESVRQLQQQLQQRGYYDGPIDGIFGTRTQQAIQSFQQDAGFNRTGQVDPATGQRLGTPDLINSGQSSVGPTTVGQEPTSPSEPTRGTTNPVSVPVARENAPLSQVPAGSGALVDGADPTDTNATDTDEAEADTTEPQPGTESTIEDAQLRVEAATESKTGVSRLLWPALALIAALGSFGVGFMLANRGKGKDEMLDDPWGQVAPEVQAELGNQWGNQADQPNNHAAVTNGKQVGAPAITTQDSPLRQPMGQVTPLSATTKLSKVNIVDELVADLQVPDPTKRRRAIWELGQRGNSTAIQPLVNAMIDADSKEKSLILAALSEIGIRSLKPMNRALAIALQDENPEVRKNAIRDLTRIYDLVAQISQMLGHATEDEDPEVRQTANWALEQLNRIRTVPDPRTMLTSAENPLKQPDLLSGEISN